MTQLSPQQRFEQNHIPVPEAGCWLWIAATIGDGYASFMVSGKQVLAHRYAYEKKYGPVPDGKELDHKCRVRCCVNPDHLEPVTHKENINRGICANTEKTHCPKGHQLSGNNLYIVPKNGKRQCRSCNREHDKKRKLKRRIGL